MAAKKLKTKIKRIEEIAEMLEENNLDLEKALSLYEEGMTLIKECGADLDRFEEKVRILNGSGDLEEEEADAF